MHLAYCSLKEMDVTEHVVLLTRTGVPLQAAQNIL